MIEIYITAKVSSMAQAHGVLAALHSLSANKLFAINPETIKMTATDNVPEELHHAPSAHVQQMLDKQFGASSEDVNSNQATTPLTPVQESDSGSSLTAESHSDACPYPPVTRIYESVRQRIFSYLRNGEQPHKDDFPCASALVQKGEIVWDGVKFTL